MLPIANRRLTVFLIGILLTAILISSGGCGSQDQGTENDTDLAGSITIAGSTSVQPLSEELAKAFMDQNPGVTVSVQGGGSSQGIRAAIDGIADIGASSRELKEEEAAEVIGTTIANDGIAVITHQDNNIEDLTLVQLQNIYSGEISNWAEVGGRNMEIAVVTREEGSGTRGAFEEIVMGENKIWTRAIVQPSTGGVREAVAGNPNAIGYVSLGYLDDSVKTIAIDNYLPTEENIKAGNYQVSRPFLYLTQGTPGGLVKDFLEFVLSDEGQEIVSRDYISVN